MSDNEETGAAQPPGSTVRPLSIRMADDLRAQLEIIAQLKGHTLTKEVRVALEGWVEAAKADPAVQKRAEQVRAEIERDAATKRGAIEAIFTTAPSTSRRGGRTAAQGQQSE